MCRLESGIFYRLAPDSSVAGVWLPRVGAWWRLRWWFRTPVASLSAGAALVRMENEGAEKAHLGKYE